MGLGRWLCAGLSVAVLACGKTIGNGEAPRTQGAAATSSSSGGSGGQGAEATQTVAVTTGVAGTGEPAPSCSYPREQSCAGECFDPRSSGEHCGHCGNACRPDQTCVQARCETEMSCEQRSVTYEAHDMEASGGTAVDDGWVLTTDSTLSVTHSFQEGPVVFRITARGSADEPRPYITLTVGDKILGPVLLGAASHASYSFDSMSLGGSEMIQIATAPAGGIDSPVATIHSLEIEECNGLHGLCEDGGYYLPEISACAPAVCSEPNDCSRDFFNPIFQGQCIEGHCRYPRCSERTESGLLLYEEVFELGRYDTSFACLSYNQLVHPLNNPRSISLDGSPESFECPAVEELTWEVERFSGEGSCVQLPICGPNAAEEVSLSSDERSCCYLISRTCGV